ncbi:hypothetical protein C8Q76DRAFT_613044 [Earliella scabrosa]|nr:hypothetical protein C8Q76DRAFT_613044 [Earliella scabrosa]
MKTFLEWAKRAQRALFAREAGPSLPLQCPRAHDVKSDPQAAVQAKVYRCFDCYNAHPMCAACIMEDHVANPFHRIEVWDPTLAFWARMSLGDLEAFAINLGHQGEPCSTQPNVRTMTIVHEHGIVGMKVRFCACPAPGELFAVPEPLQLLRFGLFPGSWKRPETAYTVNGLRDYHLLSLQCQITGIDYATYLRRSTDNVIPSDTTDRHRELNNTMREFMFLRATRRAGVDPEADLPARSLAVWCPACPQPGMNMDPNWQNRKPKDEFLDTFHHTADGNFQSSQKMKPMDATDFSLTNAAQYFVEQKDFDQYRDAVKKPAKENTTCNKFGAMGYSRFKGRVSGTVGLSCARHMVMLPCGCVDLVAGEGFCWVDYCMCSGLRPWLGLKRHCSGYDINCQYRKKFRERILKLQRDFPHLSSIQLSRMPWTIPAIGKFHAPAHTVTCRCKYSYNYLPGVGMTDGEAAERIWAVLNNLAARTKEMSSGHRHDVINDFHSDMNVRRVHGLPDLLVKRYKRAVEQSTRSSEHLNEIEENIPKKSTTAWNQEIKQWEENVLHIADSEDFETPYELNPEKQLSEKELLLKITRERGLSGETVAGIVGVIQHGVALHHENEVQRWDSLRDSYFDGLAEDATTLAEELIKHDAADKGLTKVALPACFPWRDTSKDCGATTKGLPPPRKTTHQSDAWTQIYTTPIPLPSSYHARVRDQDVMRKFVDLELDFRRAEAVRTLEDLRTNIVATEAIKMAKKKVVGKSLTTRAQARIQTADGEVTKAANQYRRHHTALLVLGMSATDPRMRPLLDADLETFDFSSEAKPGKSTRPTSWLWDNLTFVDSPADQRERDFYEEAQRVHWFRSKALAARWQEELVLLLEEMRRTLRFFLHWRNIWRARAREREQQDEMGAAAYARRCVVPPARRESHG